MRGSHVYNSPKMPAPRRAASRQEIIEAFSDMSSDDQGDLVESLNAIYRILKRDRSRVTPRSVPALFGHVEQEQAQPRETEA